MKLSSKYLILFFLAFKLSSYSNDNLDSLFAIAKNLFLEQFKVNNLNDKEGRSFENKYVIVIDGNSVHFQSNNYINNANQYLVESGDGGNILSTSELSTTQNNLANFHSRRIGKPIKVKFYTVVVNNFKFYFNKNISTIDTGAVNISKLGEYIRNEKLKNLNKETKKKIVKFQTDILNEVSSLNNADSSSNFILYTYCRLSAVDAINGQPQTKTYYRDYLGFYGAGLTNYARYIRKESSIGINTIPNQRITKIIENVINAVEVYVDGGFVPLDANYCGSSFSSILNDTKLNRKLLFNKEAESFKSFINGNTKTNTIHYDKEVAFNPQNTTFINDVLKERLSALTGNSSYKVTFYFKEIPFVIDNDSLKLFATKCVEGSSLDGNNNIIIVVPYFAQKCSGDFYFFNFGSYKGIPMPAVYCSNVTVKNGIETVLFGNGELNNRLNNLFIHVPKKQHYIFGLINYEGNLIVKTYTTQTETTGEPNVYTFKLLEDKRCKTLVANIAACQGAAASLGYTTTSGGAVNTSAGVYVSTTDFTCLKPKNNATMAVGANWQMIVHGLKESAAKSISTVMTYIQWYTHDNLIGQLIEYIPPSNDYFVGGKNEVHYQNVLSVLDAVSTALAPTGLDAFFDAGTAVYCLTQGETSDALLYSVAFVVPVASGGMIKGAVEGTNYFYIAAKDGKLKIPSLGTSCPMGGVGFDVSKKVNKKIYSTISNTSSYNKLLNLKNDPEYVGFIIHIDDAVDNAQLAQRFKENPQAIDDYFNYYKANKSKTGAEIVSGFLAEAKMMFRNVHYEDFIKTFSATEEQYKKAFEFWGEERWDELYQYFKTNHLNYDDNIKDVWPPFYGAKNIKKIEIGSQLIGKVFDRFQEGKYAAGLGGSFASPILNSGEGVEDLIFTYDSRALANQIKEGTYYYKFRIKDDIPSLIFEYGEAIPWFKLSGNADQIKSNMKFNDIVDHVEIIEKLKFESGKWINVK